MTWSTTTIPLWSPRLAVRMLLLQSQEFENAGILNGFFQSRPTKIVARCGCSLYVGLRGTSLCTHRKLLTRGCRSSWEFITTLDFEWSFIQGGRRYRWTIWVCNDGFFFWKNP